RRGKVAWRCERAGGNGKADGAGDGGRARETVAVRNGHRRLLAGLVVGGLSWRLNANDTHSQINVNENHSHLMGGPRVGRMLVARQSMLASISIRAAAPWITDALPSTWAAVRVSNSPRPMLSCCSAVARACASCGFRASRLASISFAAVRNPY